MSYQSKKHITKCIYKLIHVNNKHIDYNLIDRYMFAWWTSARSGSSFQLSNEGFNIFERVCIQKHKFKISLKDIRNKSTTKIPTSVILYSVLKKLHKKIKCPYFVDDGNSTYNNVDVYIYDEKLAIIVSLHGSLIEYLDSESI